MPQVRRLFDTVADGYGGIEFFKEFGRKLVAWAGVLPGWRVLDLAAGRGAIADAVGPNAVRVDFAERMRPDAVMDAARLGLREACFDAVLCGFALHLFPDQDGALAEVRRVLRAGGVFAYSFPGPVAEDAVPFYRGLFERYHADPGIRTNDPAPAMERAGFSAIERANVEVAVSVRDAEDFWRVEQSHGARAWYDALSAEDRVAVKREIESHITGPLTFNRGAWFVKGTLERA